MICTFCQYKIQEESPSDRQPHRPWMANAQICLNNQLNACQNRLNQLGQLERVTFSLICIVMQPRITLYPKNYHVLSDGGSQYAERVTFTVEISKSLPWQNKLWKFEIRFDLSQYLHHNMDHFSVNWNIIPAYRWATLLGLASVILIFPFCCSGGLRDC